MFSVNTYKMKSTEVQTLGAYCMSCSSPAYYANARARKLATPRVVAVLRKIEPMCVKLGAAYYVKGVLTSVGYFIGSRATGSTVQPFRRPRSVGKGAVYSRGAVSSRSNTG